MTSSAFKKTTLETTELGRPDQAARPAAAARILIVEDERLVAHQLAETLQRHGYEVCGIATTGERAIALTQAKLPHLVLMDINLKGEIDGIETASRLAPYGRPGVIFLSAYSEAETLRRANSAGAHGYLVKPIPEPTLLTTIGVVLSRRALERTNEMTLHDLKSALASAQHASLTDALTGVYNRKGMALQIAREMERARRHDQTVALMLIDIDHFKKINDELGHQVGDEIIKQAAQCIVDAVRPTDIVARYGGDEFVVFAADDCSQAGACGLGERILRRVRHQSREAGQGAIKLTASIGVVTALASEHLQVDDMVHAADLALYRAKAAGRDCLESAAISPANGTVSQG